MYVNKTNKTNKYNDKNLKSMGKTRQGKTRKKKPTNLTEEKSAIVTYSLWINLRPRGSKNEHYTDSKLNWRRSYRCQNTSIEIYFVIKIIFPRMVNILTMAFSVFMSIINIIPFVQKVCQQYQCILAVPLLTSWSLSRGVRRQKTLAMNFSFR